MCIAQGPLGLMPIKYSYMIKNIPLNFATYTKYLPNVPLENIGGLRAHTIAPS